ncbi:MAG: tetratricopeptide repeat protein [Blastocatellia bacterium]|nr:tetratricopeptide repeat protein [Blastocatellia bacterium]
MSDSLRFPNQPAIFKHCRLGMAFLGSLLLVFPSTALALGNLPQSSKRLPGPGEKPQQGSSSLRLDANTPKSGSSGSLSLRLNVSSPLRSSSSATLRLNMTELGQRLGVQQVGEAVARFERKAPAKPALSGPELQCEKADKLLDQEQFSQAIDLYNQALAKNPKLVNAYAGLSEAYIRSGDLDSATRKFQEAIAQNPNNPDLELGFGVALYRTGRIDDAIQQYNRVLEKQKQQPEAHYNLGIAYAHQGKFEEAIGEYQTALVQRNKNFPEAANNLGLIYEATGNLEKAGEQFRAAVTQRAAYPLAHYNLGRLYMALGPTKYDDAIKECQTAVNQQSNFPEAFLTLGNLYLLRSTLRDTNEFDQAITAYRKAIEQRDKFYPLAHEHLAIALTFKGNKTEAFAEYRTAIDQSDGTSFETIENMISTLLDDRDRFLIGNEQSRAANPGNLRKSKTPAPKTTSAPRKKPEKGASSGDAMLDVLSRYEDLADEVKDIADVRYAAGRAYFSGGDWNGALREMAKAYELSGSKDKDAGQATSTLLTLLSQY